MILATAPGRVNLMGEHTDYNRGLVLPTVTPQRTAIELEPRSDSTARIRSDAFGQAEYRVGHERPGSGWLDYVQGCTAVLRARGHEVRGFEARISSNVPIGAGVSSSAALEVALLRALREAFALGLDDAALALLGRDVENDFVGARVGVMDQFAASLGRPGAALFLDTADLSHELVVIPRQVDIVVVDSGVAHAHASGGYNLRRAECEEACRLLGVGSLREVSDVSGADPLPDRLRRRVRHVVSENARVRDTVAALRRGDVELLGRLFNESHASQRQDYEVSAPEVDLLADLLRRDGSVAGARLTGGGFGGAVVALVPSGEGKKVASRVLRAYERAGWHGRAIVPT